MDWKRRPKTLMTSVIRPDRLDLKSCYFTLSKFQNFVFTYFNVKAMDFSLFPTVSEIHENSLSPQRNF